MDLEPGQEAAEIGKRLADPGAGEAAGDGKEVARPAIELGAERCRSKFPVAADENSKIIDAYDAGMPMHASMANRVSYVIAPDGKVIYEYTSLSPDQHVANTLNAVKEWAATHR